MEQATRQALRKELHHLASTLGVITANLSVLDGMISSPGPFREILDELKVVAERIPGHMKRLRAL